MRKLFFVIIPIFILVCLSCVSHAKRYESTAKFLFKEGEDSKIHLLTLGMSNNDSAAMMVNISSPLMPAIEILGEAEEETDGLSITITELRFFSNWPNGWTQGIYEASGKLRLVPGEDSWRCFIEDPLEIWDILKGEIRFFDTYYRRDDGLVKVRNRIDRMRELCRFLHEEKGFPGLIGHTHKNSIYGLSFIKQIGPFLFPERYNFSKLERNQQLDPAFYAYPGKKSAITWGADLSWRTDYSEAAFPEHLQELRNSGTLWRDYEETLPLLFSIYNLEHFFSEVISKIEFKEE